MTKPKASVQEEVSPNLIPMVDIMFLLLLFFMLSADMGQRQFEEVRPPVAKSALKVPEGNDGALTINVFHAPEIVCKAYAGKQICREDLHWRTNVAGTPFQDQTGLAGYLQSHAPRSASNPGISDRKVMIRVDSGAPYGLAQRAMNACAETGLYRIEVGAAMPAKPKKS